MNIISQILKYGRNTHPNIRNIESFISKNSDKINDGLGATNDIISNAQIGRELVQFSKYSTKISPIFEENYVKNVNNIIENHLDKLELTQNLTDDERKKFINNIRGDESSFVTFSLGGKPSLLIAGNNQFIKPSEKYDILRRTLTIPVNNKDLHINNTIILNKKLVKETIKNNQNFYINRMNLDKDTSVDEIYNELIGDDSPLKRNEKHDLIGITLGYSPINSIIYQLDQNIPNNIELRKDLNTYKKNLINTLLKADSPYNNFDNKFKAEIAKQIRDIGTQQEVFNTKWDKYGFSYRNIVPDNEHDQKLIKNIISCSQKAEAILQEDT